MRTAAVALLLLVTLAALFAPLIASGPNVNNLGVAFQGPSTHHLLGTDELGRDILTRLMWGGRISLLGIAQALVVYLPIGLVFGLLAGYLGGITDTGVSWVAEMSFAMPQIIVILAVLAIFTNSTATAMLALGVLGAPGLAVFVRGATKSVSAELYVAAARVMGLGTVRILGRHVLPRIAGAVTVQVSLFCGTALLFQTGLDFLSLGTQPPTASWGAMVAEGAAYIGRDLWMVLPAGILIVLVITAFGLVGDLIQERGAHARGNVSASADAAPAGRKRSHGSDQKDAVKAIGDSIDVDPDTDFVLEVRHLTIATATAPIVEGASFSLRRGQCLGLVGESGSGKTMTAMGILGLLPVGVAVTSGAVKFNGREIHRLNEREMTEIRGSRIALITQEAIASLDPSFKVASQIIEVIRRHSKADKRTAKAEALQLLEQVGIADPTSVARRFPHQLSGGMAQRVGIALALAGKPDVLIADEPTSALDVTVQAEVLDLLRSLRESSGLSVILVSHDWGVIADACDAAVVMYAGQVVEMAPILELFRQPRHPYSLGLLRSNPDGVAPRTLLSALPGAVPGVGAWPRGCHFADRCSFCTPECTEGPIAIASIAPGHVTRCIHPARVAADLATAGAST